MNGGLNWTQDVLTDFTQLISGGRRLIYIHNDTSIPLIFTDIYPDAAAYEDRRTPSFSNMLMAKGHARQMDNAQIVAWYNAECTQLVDSDATASLRMCDVLEFQMPTICFAASAVAGNQPSYNQSYVVGNVTAMPSLSAAAGIAVGDKKQMVDKHEFLRTGTDRLQREKMDRVNSWLKQGAQQMWKEVAVKMHVVDGPDAASAGGSKPGNQRPDVPGNQRPDVRASSAEGESYKAQNNEHCKPWDKKSSGTDVPVQSNLVSSSVGVNGRQQKSLRSQSEMYNERPERDMNRCDESRSKPNQSYGDSRRAHDRSEAVGDGRARPLFSREQNTSSSRERPNGSPAEKKSDSVTPKQSRDKTSAKLYASGVEQKTNTEASPCSADTETDGRETNSHTKPRDDGGTTGKKSPAKKSSACAEDTSSTRSASVGSDNKAVTSGEKLLNAAAALFSPAPAVKNSPPNLHVTEDEVCSESSSSLLTAAKTHVESDAYLTANESATSLSATPPKKSFSVTRATVSHVEVSSEVGDLRQFADDDETMPDDRTVDSAAAAKDASHHQPSVKLVIPESRRVMVLVSSVESPNRFWVNVASEALTQLDWVTEMLNTSPLQFVDPVSSSVQLHQWFCVHGVTDELIYRGELIEVCYSDDQCKRRLSDNCATCRCDQLMRSPTDAVKAVRVCVCNNNNNNNNLYYHG